jgi:membrane-bound metal-dependent hydrolase YbcI (DUF457 family)
VTRTDDPALVDGRVAYVREVRAHRRNVHTLGFAVCLVGVLLLAWVATQGPGARSPLGFSAVGVIVAGWAILIYVVMARQAYVRAHPFDPNA